MLGAKVKAATVYCHKIMAPPLCAQCSWGKNVRIQKFTIVQHCLRSNLLQSAVLIFGIRIWLNEHFYSIFGHSAYCVCCLVVIVLTCSILSSLSE